MSGEVDQTRRWLINASGAAVLRTRSARRRRRRRPPPSDGPRRDVSADPTVDQTPISTDATVIADYVSTALDRDLPAAVVAATKLHILDTIAAITSGSRLKAGDLAARYVASLGGNPQATVVGTRTVTSAPNAALANAMAAHADETDDTNPIGPVHLGCAALPAALATAEFAGRTGRDLVRAVSTAYDIGARVVSALGYSEASRRHSGGCLTNTFTATAAAAAMLRLDQRQVRYAFSYAAQQASGIGFWTRDREHVEKAFDFGGMGARNGVTAATMVAMGCSAVEDPFGGDDNIYTALGEKPAPKSSSPGWGRTSRCSAPRSRNGRSARRCNRCSIPSRRCSATPRCAPTISAASGSTCRPRPCASSTMPPSPTCAPSTSSR